MSSSGRAASKSPIASIPQSVKKTIEHIREIVGQKHSEDDIYAMLKECSMDPNETAQKLLLLDTFHEVKRKRDRKKENSNKEHADPRRKPDVQSRPIRGGRGGHPPRYSSHYVTENITGQTSDKRVGSSVIASPSASIVHETRVGAVNPSNAAGDASQRKLEGQLPVSSSGGLTKNLNIAGGAVEKHGPEVLNSSNSATSIPSYFSSSDPVLVPSQESSAVGVIRRDIGSQHTPVEQISGYLASGVVTSTEPQKVPIHAPGVGHVKDSKPKGTVIEGDTTSQDFTAHSRSQSTASPLGSEDSTLLLRKKLEKTQISDGQHVILPDHIHVPEADKLGFCFGSFDASFGLDTSHYGSLKGDASPPTTESSEATDGTEQEPSESNQNELADEDDDTGSKDSDIIQSSAHGLENFPAAESIPVVADNIDESKQEVSSGSRQETATQISSNYNLGFLPPILNGPLESSQSLAPRFPGFVVPQSIDPASYYAQLYRSSVDSDGRILPFLSATKFDVNPTVTSVQTSQSPQELQGGASLNLSTTAATPLVTQAAGVMQSTQHILPVFRQPTGVHLPHYPPNYIPYGPYFSPFYVPQPAIHHFLSNNAAYAQQPQVGNMFPTPPGSTTKSQFKQVPSTGNLTYHGYVPYGLSPANFSSGPAGPAVSAPPSSEDLAASQLKEHNIRSEGSGVLLMTLSPDISMMQAPSFSNLPQGQLPFTLTQPSHGSLAGIFNPPPPALSAAMVHHPLLQQSQPTANMAGPTGNGYQQTQQHGQQPNRPSNF